MLLLLLARIMQPGAGDIGKGEYGCGCGEKQHRRKAKIFVKTVRPWEDHYSKDKYVAGGSTVTNGKFEAESEQGQEQGVSSGPKYKDVCVASQDCAAGGKSL